MSDEQLRKPLSVDEQDDLFRQMEKWLRSHDGSLSEKKMLPDEMENMFRMMATILTAREAHPADGDELVDEGWLLSLNEFRWDDDEKYFYSSENDVGCRVYISGGVHEGNWSYGRHAPNYLIPTPKTREGVRSLLAALGVK